ncbi:immunoglobulin-like domain-containing protein [Paenibacillus sp. OV219]|uniref:immunoglobulin-like domain-containing protein n=1 Tax=Paenibacillus sp. OV219 TaxID=1884377 RepID=UPI0008CC9590|nr:immunoglobulin-like domain-containing protein [Paenibacillus sp. OV219]SEP18888.1 hypothetical protein SAMN05518847_1291 [Paenibacillus sp. OV219]
MKTFLILVLISISITACSLEQTESNQSNNIIEPSIGTLVEEYYPLNDLQKSMKITITLDKSAYEQGDRLGITVTNNSDVHVSLGTNEVKIQTPVNSEWETITLDNYAYDSIGIVLKPGGHYTDNPIILKYLLAGKYRVVKRIRLGEKSEPQIFLVSDPFTLK